MSAQNGDGGPSAIVLKHPGGATVYLVGTAHVSRKAAEEVAQLINRVSPAIVVLELDPEREHKLLEQAERGDTYGIERMRSRSTWEVVKLSLSGEALNYFMASLYTVAGAVMGTTPGAEFLAAIEAARGCGAHVVLGDRDNEVTMRRLRFYTAALTRRDSRAQADMRRMRKLMDSGRQEDGGVGPSLDGPGPLDVGSPPDFLRGEPPPTRAEAEVEAEVQGTTRDPWGLGPGDSTEEGMRRRLLEMMREGGCPKPNAVLEAARRIFQNGLDPKGRIEPADILTVRECGNSLVESFRQRAIKGDDTWMVRLEEEQVAGAKGVAGMERSNVAMRKVIVDERDVILARRAAPRPCAATAGQPVRAAGRSVWQRCCRALLARACPRYRRLWEAGEEAGSQPVVGVVGAGHLKGIAAHWAASGDPATEQRVQRLLQPPRDEPDSPWLTAAVGVAVVGTIAVRRPRAAAMFAGAVALVAAPYIGFMAVTVNRFGKFASKLVSTVEAMDAANGNGPSFAQDLGWQEEGGGDTFQ